MTREDRLAEIEDYVHYLDALYDHVLERAERGDTRVCVLGFSQGVATVCRWLARGRSRANRLVLWGATVPPDFDFEHDAGPLRDAELWLVAGTRDKFTTIERITAERERLRAHDIAHRLVTFDGGHRLDRNVLRELATT